MKEDKMNLLKLLPVLGLGLNDPRSLKRTLMTLLGTGIVALNNKFGLGLSDLDKELIAAFIIPAVMGSNYLDAAKAKGQEAADGVKTPEDANSVISGTPNVPSWLVALLGTTLMLVPMTSQAQTQPQTKDVPTVDRSSELAKVKVGDPAPFDGVVYSTALHIDVAKRIVNCETTLKEVEPAVVMRPWVTVLTVVGSVIVGAAVAVPIAYKVGEDAGKKAAAAP